MKLKKCLIILLVIGCFITVTIFTSTNILAETKEGLQATWYQAEAYIGDPAGLGNLLNDLGDFDDASKELFEGNSAVFTKIGTNTLETFELKGGNSDFSEITNGLDLLEEATDMDLTLSEGGANVFATVIEYNGYITAKEGGTYEFISKYCDNNLILEIDGVRVFESWGGFNFTPPNPSDADYINGTKTVKLEAGVPKKLHAYYLKQGGGHVLMMEVKKDKGAAKEFASMGFKLTYETNAAQTQSPAQTTSATAATTAATATATAMATATVTTAATTAATITTAAQTTDPISSNPANTDESDFPVVPVIIGGIGVAAIGGGAAIYIIKKKKK